MVELELGNPLRLSKTMRARLLGAVRSLVSDAALAGVSDGARLASVVLTAKADVRHGYRTDIRTKELGRWLGVSASTVAHTVLPELRGREMLGSKVTTNEVGHATGLGCWVIPMYRAQRAGDRRHALALTRPELAVLLRLIEVLFAPGWTHEDGSVTPAGLLADRTGRGAATDRLGLLLMVLASNSKGWLRLCSGAVDAGRGRPAATVGRLLGCSPAAGAKVLQRLQKRGALAVERRETASGLNARSRVRLLPVAQAHGRLVPEAREAADTVFSDLAAAARSDHETAGDAVTRVVTGIEGAGEGERAGFSDLAAAADLHASHACVVTEVSSLSLSGGFSGEGRGGYGDRPKRASVREDQATKAAVADRLRLVDCEGGPLRGEQPKKSPVVEGGKAGQWPGMAVAGRAGDGAGPSSQPRGRVPLPSEDLRAILAPVQLLWARLERPAARRLVEGAVRTALVTVEGHAGRTDAPKVLADRLTRRLDEQNRLGSPISDPVGWLVSRGLPQRQNCGDVRCDEGLRLDTGGVCETCQDVRADRRDRRHQVAATVDAAMPHASPEERLAATERQLHETVTAQAWTRAIEWEQVRIRQAAAVQARAEAAAAQVAAAPVALPAPRPAATPEPDGEDVDQQLVLEDLNPEQVRDWRVRAMKDHQVVFDHIDVHGETLARRLFSNRLVDQAQRLAGTHHLVLGHTTWGQA